MAKNKTRRRQGVVSYATSVISLLIGFSGVFAAFKAGGIAGVANRASFGLLEGGQLDLAEGASIYVPMIGGLIFKAIASELTKKARIQSLIPRIG